MDGGYQLRFRGRSAEVVLNGELDLAAVDGLDRVAAAALESPIAIRSRWT
jgi:hypothetical protein